MTSTITTGLLGLSVADAIGVPVEFQSRAVLDANPVADIRGFGTYNQPPGYFSDDSSLAFGLAESLAKGSFDLVDQAQKLMAYKYSGYWTPEGKVFDIGMTTSSAIDRLVTIIRAKRETSLAYLKELAMEQDNGNGALMRIFSLYAYLRHRPLEEWLEPIWQHSALTHGHERSAWCCLLYLRFCHHVVGGHTFPEALQQARQDTIAIMAGKPKPTELEALQKLLHADFSTLPRTQVQGNGYVVFSLEAAFWSLFNATDYRSAVLNAVNLGEDTDTTACIAGAPAALFYGQESIPVNWLAALARREEITALGQRLEQVSF